MGTNEYAVSNKNIYSFNLFFEKIIGLSGYYFCYILGRRNICAFLFLFIFFLFLFWCRS